MAFKHESSCAVTFAVVPACGRSSRMGQSKLSMPMYNSTVIERVVHTLQTGGVDVVLVVTGPHHAEIVSLAARAGAAVMELPTPTEDMRATVEVGLAYIQSKYQPTSDDVWLLAPGDFPAFSRHTVSLLFQSAMIQTLSGIVVPKYRGKRGHPLLLRWKHVEAIKSLNASAGINAIVHEHPFEVQDVEVNDPGIHMNLNTPADFSIIEEHLRHVDIDGC